jgi:dimeric dUTPase (all-alpha-NTP-PPase superfamily)
MPTKTVKYKKHKHKGNPWITSGLIKSIKFRDKLYQKLKKTSQESALYDQLKLNLGTYNKILRKAIREAQQLYYHSKFNSYKNDIKNTWITIKSIINKSKGKQDIPDFFLINGTKITYKQDIVNQFNKYFTNIGESLAAKISAPPNKTYKDYLKQPSRLNFTFGDISNSDTLNIINSLQAKTSRGHDHVSSALLKN